MIRGDVSLSGNIYNHEYNNNVHILDTPQQGGDPLHIPPVNGLT